MELGRHAGITVLPGLEICTREEVHILAIHGAVEQAKAVEEIVYQGLTQKNVPDLFGFQIIADSEDMVLGEEDKLLIQASLLTVKQAVDLIHQWDGLAIAAHIDRPSYSILGQLGFMPENSGLDGVEISAQTIAQKQEQYFLDKTTLPCLVSSDAHFLKDMGKGSTVFHITYPTFKEMASALKTGDIHMETSRDQEF